MDTKERAIAWRDLRHVGRVGSEPRNPLPAPRFGGSCLGMFEQPCCVPAARLCGQPNCDAALNPAAGHLWVAASISVRYNDRKLKRPEMSPSG